MSRPQVAAEDIRHGTYLGYSSDGCRCEDCRTAKADYVRERRERGLEVDTRRDHSRRLGARRRTSQATAEHHRRALWHLKDVHNPPRRACAECRELFAEGNLR